ncbi:hypothetical protein WAI453_000888 [Rhynchosporium graminicola]
MLRSAAAIISVSPVGRYACNHHCNQLQNVTTPPKAQPSGGNGTSGFHDAPLGFNDVMA